MQAGWTPHEHRLGHQIAKDRGQVPGGSAFGPPNHQRGEGGWGVGGSNRVTIEDRFLGFSVWAHQITKRRGEVKERRSGIGSWGLNVWAAKSPGGEAGQKRDDRGQDPGGSFWVTKIIRWRGQVKRDDRGQVPGGSALWPPNHQAER